MYLRNSIALVESAIAGNQSLDQIDLLGIKSLLTELQTIREAVRVYNNCAEEFKEEALRSVLIAVTIVPTISEYES